MGFSISGLVLFNVLDHCEMSQASRLFRILPNLVNLDLVFGWDRYVKTIVSADTGAAIRPVAAVDAAVASAAALVGFFVHSQLGFHEGPDLGLCLGHAVRR